MISDFSEIDEFDELDGGFDQSSTDSGENSKYEHFRFVIDKGQTAIRIDKYLTMHIVNSSRTKIQAAADAQNILVNDKPVKANYKLKPLDVITVLLNYPPRETDIEPENIPIEIVYEDDDLLVVNKKPGMVVHPGFGNYEGTLLNAIAWHFKDDPKFNKEVSRLGLVHRIDKDTSGLLVIAKNEFAKMFLAQQFFHKTTERLYQAVVWGVLKEDSGTVDTYLGRNPKDRLQFANFEDDLTGAKHAVTHYQVLERFHYVSLVQCKLETGRTHQIRVHMKHIGHTLFNDKRYGGDIALRGTHFAKYKHFVQNCFDACPRQALHAKTLGFVHPTTKEKMYFESPLPDDILELLERWRRYS